MALVLFGFGILLVILAASAIDVYLNKQNKESEMPSKENEEEVPLLWQGRCVTIPLEIVQHIENRNGGIMVITKHTHYNSEMDGWGNNAWIGKDEMDSFITAWKKYLSSTKK